jgi:hypothetical protein
MRALEDEEMESSSKIDLKDVLWWMSIKGAYRLGALVTAKLLKEGCVMPVCMASYMTVNYEHANHIF